MVTVGYFRGSMEGHVMDVYTCIRMVCITH